MSPQLFVDILWRSLPEWMQLQFREAYRAWEERRYYRQMAP
jgi:hypothetical protein